jgi:hypothetical protein
VGELAGSAMGGAAGDETALGWMQIAGQHPGVRIGAGRTLRPYSQITDHITAQTPSQKGLLCPGPAPADCGKARRQSQKR